MTTFRVCEMCNNPKQHINDYGPCLLCGSRLSSLRTREGAKMMDYRPPKGESGKRYCQTCSVVQFVQNPEDAKPCRACGGINFDINPKPHIGVLRGFWLTEKDRIFLKVQRIYVDEKEGYGDGATEDSKDWNPRQW